MGTETRSIQTDNETVVLNKETELKEKGYSQVSEKNNLKPFEYIKRISSSSEDKFSENTIFYISWHI